MSRSRGQPNDLLRRARLGLSSPSGSGRPMSRRELADIVSRFLSSPVDDKYIGKLERGEYRWPNEEHRLAIRRALGAGEDADLGFYITRSQPSNEVVTPPVDWEHEMRRRDFLGGLGGVAGLGLAAQTPPVAAWASHPLSRLLDALLPMQMGVAASDGRPALSPRQLSQRVAAAKTGYQACRYEQVLNMLPGLLDALSVAQSAAGGGELAWLRLLTSDAYHVVGSVLLKFGDHAMALVAAECSVRFARANGDPIAAGSSARIMTHALMSNGHTGRAVQFAESAADALDRATRLKSADALAVYGALALRGAVSAARTESRQAAQTLLDEASRAATVLGRDGNDHWTGFGPTNVLLHRVNVSLALGDAGTAIAHARQVDLDKIELAERKACLFVDVAGAYTQWGHHEKALTALRTAARIAPEEVRTRPTVRRIVTDLVALAHGQTRSRVVEFATTTGIRL